MDEQINIRTVKVGGNVYLRKEDVADMLRSLGATEETDVRNRLEEMARSVENFQ